MSYPSFRALAFAFAASLVATASAQILIPRSSVRSATAPGSVHTNYEIYQGIWRKQHLYRSISGRQGGIPGYYPSDIRSAYNLPTTGGAGAIAIIEAYDLPTSLNDFNVFASNFNLPTETSTTVTSAGNQVFQVVYAAGTKPAKDANWGGEIALDMEWAHAIAPGAKIYVIECASDSFSDIITGVQVAATLPNVREVSMSFGAAETPNESSFDSNFTAANQVYFAAAGDTSNEMDYPAASPNVIGVGGTSLTTVVAPIQEMAWSQGGGGPSAYEPLPAYQIGFTTLMRGVPDAAANADPNTGCAVYDSTPIPHEGSGWMVDGGTSLATPILAGITNLRGSFSTNSFNELVRQYGLAGTGNYREIVSGSDGIYTAHSHYNFITGLGAMIGLYPSSVFAPNTLIVNIGTPIGGLPDNVIAKDNHAFVIRSVLETLTQQAIEVTGSFVAPLPSGFTRSAAAISITGMTTGHSMAVYLYNFSTSELELVPSSSLTSVNGAVSIPIPNQGSYFDSGGNVQFEIFVDTVNSLVTPSPFQLGLDQIQLGVTTIS